MRLSLKAIRHLCAYWKNLVYLEVIIKSGTIKNEVVIEVNIANPMVKKLAY
jgi:hypothetical protein